MEGRGCRETGGTTGRRDGTTARGGGHGRTGRSWKRARGGASP
jgi:hypothetical protein